MVTYAVQHQLYSHLPPRQIFQAVYDRAYAADGLIAIELKTICGVAPTPSNLAYYRDRINTWLRLLGLTLCLEIMSSDPPASSL